ncbi:MAG: pentapeptide repeat-containing protein [Calothrix sp. SM1_7_51]|nr:pentapeptide repeat-containing protein [Calothrix sp. SM1_7_51]
MSQPCFCKITRQLISKGANLQFANLQSANLQAADLQDANLKFTKLQFVNFQQADFQGTQIQGAEIQGADFRDAKYLTPEQVKAAKTGKEQFLVLISANCCKHSPIKYF